MFPATLSDKTLDRTTLLVVVLHVALKILCLLHMWDVEISGDEGFYARSSRAIEEVGRSLLSSGDVDLEQAVDSVVERGWFMPGMAVLLLPLRISWPDASVGEIRLYAGLVTLLLYLCAIWQVRRHIDRASALAVAAVLGLSPMWTLFSLTIWGDLTAGLLVAILAAWAVEYGRGLALGNVPGARQTMEIGALLAGVVLMRSSGLPLVAMVLLLLMSQTLVFIPRGRELGMAFVRIGLAGAVFLALLLPWSAMVSKSFGTPVLTTTNLPLSIGITFGARDRLCDGPCPPGTTIWSRAFDHSQAIAEETGENVLSVQRRMASNALRGSTPGRYLARVKNNFRNYYLKFDSFMDRFATERGASAPGSLLTRHRAFFDGASRILYWIGFSALLLAAVWPVRAGIETQVLSLTLKLLALGSMLQPFVNVSHGRYWTSIAPLFALSVPLLLTVAFGWGRAGRDVTPETGPAPAKQAERRLFIAQLPAVAVVIALYALLGLAP